MIEKSSFNKLRLVASLLLNTGVVLVVLIIGLVHSNLIFQKSYFETFIKDLAKVLITSNSHSIEVGVSRNLASCMEGNLDYSSLAPPQQGEASNITHASQIESSEFDFRKLNEWLPAEIAPDEKGGVVINKIADKGVQSFLTSESFKSSSLGRLNEKVKEETKMEVKLSRGGKTEHKISANLEPFQQGAKVGYTGVIGLELSYYIPNKIQTLKLVETILDKKIYYENSVSLIDRHDHFGVQWDW